MADSRLQDSFDDVKLKAGMTLLLMGTAGEVQDKPVEKIKFAEDMAAAEVAAAVCRSLARFCVGC